jgi:2-polyprenyl-6-hydroxyphenyl methylase/3-demethylubiquinone-9 3-methyltransferase
VDFPYNPVMPVDNDLYTRDAHTWWDEESFLHILRVGVNPVRVEYIDDVLSRMGQGRTGLNVLDVGCGGGYLPEELTHLFGQVYGVDASRTSLAAAHRHAIQMGLKVAYRVARAESLPFADAVFDVVTCCDVLEHVGDLDRTLAEVARVLKPGGIFIYDTINRTFMTWLGIIFVAQEFPLTRFFPEKTHDWHMFIRPEELKVALLRQGIVTVDVRGMSPAVSPLHHFWLIANMKWGRLSYREYGLRTRLHLSHDLTMNYIGYGDLQGNQY